MGDIVARVWKVPVPKPGIPTPCPECHGSFTSFYVFPNNRWAICVNPKCRLFGQGRGVGRLTALRIGTLVSA